MILTCNLQVGRAHCLPQRVAGHTAVEALGVKWDILHCIEGWELHNFLSYQNTRKDLVFFPKIVSKSERFRQDLAQIKHICVRWRADPSGLCMEPIKQYNTTNIFYSQSQFPNNCSASFISCISPLASLFLMCRHFNGN